jgi:hypothetical protein
MDQDRRRNSTGEQVMLEVDMGAKVRGKQTLVSDYKKK